MRSWVLAACLVAAAGAAPALAADMDDGTMPPHGGIYDEPRYSPKARPPAYDDNDDDDDGYYGGPPRKKYTGTPYDKTCVRSEEVRDRLTNQGWRDFHDGRPSGEVVTLRARRPNGRLFELTLLRCSGQIVDARPLEARPLRPFAFRPPQEPYGAGRWGWNRWGYEDPWFERPYAYRWPRRWHRED